MSGEKATASRHRLEISGQLTFILCTDNVSRELVIQRLILQVIRIDLLLLDVRTIHAVLAINELQDLTESCIRCHRSVLTCLQRDGVGYNQSQQF